VTAAYDVWVTSSAPTGTAVSSNSQAPALPIVACSAAAVVQPVKPPACTMPPRVTRVPRRVGRLLEQARRGEQQQEEPGDRHPAARRERTQDAEAPQTPAASGNRKAA